MASQLPEVPTNSSNHYKNFLLACKGQEQARSPFDVAGPLLPSVQPRRAGAAPERETAVRPEEKVITNNERANKLLKDLPPREGWEEFYKL